MAFRISIVKCRFLLRSGTLVPWKENIPHFSNHHHGKCSSAKSSGLVCVYWKGNKIVNYKAD